MTTRAIRGAITLEENTTDEIKSATEQLISLILKENSITSEDISHVIFTCTKDINAAFPAKYARELFNWNYVPMMCYNELDVPNALPKCLRILVVINTEKTQKEIKHIYLKNAKKLRPDL